MLSYIIGIFRYLFFSKISIRAIIDKKSNLTRKTKINRSARIIDSKVGEYTYVGIDTWICVADVGKFCSIANRVNIGLGNHSYNFLSTSPIFTESKNGTGFSWIKESIPYSFKRTFIGNDVWIGFGAMIIGGVKIGDGAVIGAGSIVTKDVPPFAIVAGCPAKIIKYRFSQEKRAQILSNPWWNKTDSELKKDIHIFQRIIE